MRQFIVIILVLALVFPLDVVADEDKHDFILIMYEVMAAAGNADLVALSELMADDFKYSFGGSPSKEEARGVQPEGRGELVADRRRGCAGGVRAQAGRPARADRGAMRGPLFKAGISILIREPIPGRGP